MVLTGLTTLGALGVSLLTGETPSPMALGVLSGFPIAVLIALAAWPRWSLGAILFLVGVPMASMAAPGQAAALAFVAAVACLAAPSLQIREEWERAVVFRLGRFRNVAGPGLHVLVPLVDRVVRIVDLRIRVTDFTAQQTLTRDSVAVAVDALCFWMVWDPEKAVCEVQDYEQAVTLSAQTALRNAVSQADLSEFLESGDKIEDRIRTEVDQKTTEWGLTVQHIEITDIQIPEALQKSLSRLARAEREKAGRVLLAEAEVEIAKKLEEAARIYGSDGTAMRLKNLSILNEGLSAGNSMILVPDSLAEELKSKEFFGLQALNEIQRTKKEK